MKVDDINEVVEGFKEEGDYARYRFICMFFIEVKIIFISFY
ncbi:MAG: hypothetical protein WBG43_03375 [Marinifilaceae bacterium]